MPQLLALKMWAVFLPNSVYGGLIHYYFFLYKLFILNYNNTIMNLDIIVYTTLKSDSTENIPVVEECVLKL